VIIVARYFAAAELQQMIVHKLRIQQAETPFF